MPDRKRTAKHSKTISKQDKPKPGIDPMDFAKVELVFQPLVANLSTQDHDAATAAFAKFAVCAYRYARKLSAADGEYELSRYLYHRDRTSTGVNLDIPQLALQLAMPGKYPPLSMTMRRSLALKFAYAMKQKIKSAALAEFLAKPPAVKKMKEALGLVPASSMEENAVDPSPRSAPVRKRPARRKRKPHRLHNSRVHRSVKAAARARRRGSPTEEA